MMLPVCSIGVIPVAYELRRAGLRGGAILAFALTAPLFNPLSMLYGLTLSTPIVIMSFALGSLLVVTTVGMLWDWLFPNTEVVEPPPTPVPPGPKRLAAVALVAARHMAGPTAIVRSNRTGRQHCLGGDFSLRQSDRLDGTCRSLGTDC